MNLIKPKFTLSYFPKKFKNLIGSADWLWICGEEHMNFEFESKPF